MEAARIQGQGRKLRRHDDGPEESVTAMEASSDRDDPEDSMTTTEASAEEEEETTRLIERLRKQRRRYVYRPRELTTTTFE